MILMILLQATLFTVNNILMISILQYSGLVFIQT